MAGGFRSGTDLLCPEMPSKPGSWSAHDGGGRRPPEEAADAAAAAAAAAVAAATAVGEIPDMIPPPPPPPPPPCPPAGANPLKLTGERPRGKVEKMPVVDLGEGDCRLERRSGNSWQPPPPPPPPPPIAP